MNRTPIESFLDLTRKSGLVDPARLNQYLEKLEQTQNIPEDTKELAAIFVRDAVLSRFQADQLLANKWRGFYVGKYRVIERIGIGGMGQVYLAEHRTMKRRYAIKVLPRAKASDPASLERFEREARAGGSIDHPNIVRAYDKDQDGDLHYLVMDFVDGCSLAEIVAATGPLDAQRAGNYLYQSALGLKHAHDSGLIHRDIKPANILIDREGVVKILDMGLARFFNDHDDMITKKYDETVLGTADYLSPEQAIDSHSVDIRSDIYSLGCTFYYTLTGQPPFGEGSVAQKLIWHQTRAPKPLTELREGIPPELSAIVIKCMMKKADDRYESPAALIQALEQYANFNYPPTAEELADLSPLARGVPFGGDILSGVSIAAAGTPDATAKDPDSRSTPVTDANVAPRGGEDSTVSIRSGDSSAAHKALNPNQPLISPVAPAPTLPVMVTPAKAAGIAPRPYSSPPIIIGKDPPAPILPESKKKKKKGTNEWDPYSTPLPFPSPLGEQKVQVLPAKEQPNVARRMVPLWVWLALVIGVLAALLATVMYFVLRDRGGKPVVSTSVQPTVTGSRPTTGPTTWYVAKNKLEGIHHLSIGAALKAASTGDTIIITDRQTYSEALSLNSSFSTAGLANVTIKAEISEDGKRARLTPPPGHPVTQPLISIEGIEGIKIIGLLLDGEDDVQTTLEVKGSCPGLTLEDVRIEGFQQQGILADNLKGNTRREVRFDKLHIKQNSPQPSQAAIKLQGAACEGLQLRHCKMQGNSNSTILFAAPTQRFLMEHCMLYSGKGKALLWSEAIPANSRMNVTIQQNTFWDYETGLSLEVPMIPGEIYFTLRNNIFYQVKNVLQIDPAKAKIKPETLSGSLTGKGNVFNTPASQPGLTIPKWGLAGLTFDLNTSMTPAKDFLRYPASSPLQTAGERKDPVGATE